MHKLANISKFESLMNRANMGMGSNMVFNDGGEWKSDGWHSINEVPPVVPDDGWNDMRRTDPEEFVRCGLVSPDDGKNWLRLANPGRFDVTEKVKKHNDLVKKRDGYKQQKRRDELQKLIDDLEFDIEGHITKGDIPYNADEYERIGELLGNGDGKVAEGVSDANEGIEPEEPEKPESPEEAGEPEYAEEDMEFGPDMKPLPIDVELEQDWSGLTEEEINERLAKASKESGLMDADYIMSTFKVG